MPTTYTRYPRAPYGQNFASVAAAEAFRKPFFIDEIMVNVSPRATPFQTLCRKGRAVRNTRVQWSQQSLNLNSTGLATSITAVAALTRQNLTVTSGTGGAFQFGSELRVRKVVGGVEQSEVMWVYQEPIGDSIPVVRGYDGTAPLAFTDTPTDPTVRIDIVGVALPGNLDTPRLATPYGDQFYNFTQRFEGGFQIDDEQKQMDLWSVTDDQDLQLVDRMAELKIKLERALFQGVRVAPDPQLQTPSLLGGLDYYVTQNVTSMSGAAITELQINNTVRQVWDNVAENMEDLVIICGSAVKQQITRLYTHVSSTNYRVELPVRDRAGITLQRILTEFGEVDLLLHKWCPPDRVYFMNMNQVYLCPMRGMAWHTKPLAEGGFYTKLGINGVYTLVVKAPETHALIKDVSTTVV